jgi:hypothetical protein
MGRNKENGEEMLDGNEDQPREEKKDSKVMGEKGKALRCRLHYCLVT